jgi:hypothetical protein
MSGTSTGTSSGPCNYESKGPDIDFEDDDHDFVNPLLYFISEIAPPFLPAPKAQRYPEVPIRTVDWSHAAGTKPAIKSTLVPFPFPGVGPAMKVDQPIPRGTEGLNTAILIMVDRSGSMSPAPAFIVEGKMLDRVEVARGLTCALIRMAQNQGDHFAVLSYGNSSYTEWPQSPAGNLGSWKSPLSKEYEEAFAFFSQYKPDMWAKGLPPPIPCNDGTDHSQAVEGLFKKISGTGVDSVVSFVITDDFLNSYEVFDGIMASEPKTGIPFDTLLRRNQSKIYYFGIGNRGMEPTGRRVAKEINERVEQHYGCMPNPKPAYFFPLDPSDPEMARKMAKLMLELAGTDNKGNNCS